jgi:tRNA wybutosine-synthesizing protein 2
MSFKQKLSEKYGLNPADVPGSYQIIGDVLLLKFINKKAGAKEKKRIAETILQELGYVRMVCESIGIDGELRKPKTKTISIRQGASKSMETIHKEHGVLYKIDVGNLMFSKGNLLERQRLIEQIKPDETVVDMFAGIGYFSLALGKFSKANKIYAIEKNRTAFKYLKQNIKLNEIKNIVPVLGDCRRNAKKAIADRVLMGYFPGTQKFLPAAFKMLKSNGVIHYHNIYRAEDLWQKPLEELDEVAKKTGFKITSIVTRKIKSYAPGREHIVIDAGFEKI